MTFRQWSIEQQGEYFIDGKFVHEAEFWTIHNAKRQNAWDRGKYITWGSFTEFDTGEEYLKFMSELFPETLSVDSINDSIREQKTEIDSRRSLSEAP